MPSNLVSLPLFSVSNINTPLVGVWQFTTWRQSLAEPYSQEAPSIPSTMALLATQNVSKFRTINRFLSCLDCDFHDPGRIKARGSPFWEFDGASLCIQFNCLLLEGVISIYDS
ncbi:hypothetical protein BO83DRAFT_106147 [Aspergillus eucalypticola CBS 122712]|uniref:Uncharacterized protein n=1 Tax=Aspergillus eucalypticola (strain CBS 122712 / IBT 29274) TaxID=1448314 RepID=A0A317UWY3_ASPEC|nr:uncharacterized protein BO83DRAFT_106147 [Aspergillus eucalypticola CBS 122712]PWY66534.1 hypothetical protein BO83DRAFT_106147 [Aspergillus eucalypticola CBS 122712]